MFDNVAQKKPEGIFLEHLIIPVKKFFIRDHKVIAGFFLVNNETTPFEHYRKRRGKLVQGLPEPTNLRPEEFDLLIEFFNL